MNVVEEILRALNNRRGKEYWYRLDYVDEDEDYVYVELSGSGSFSRDDLKDITRICEENGYTLDYFDVELDEEKLVLVLSLALRGRK